MSSLLFPGQGSQVVGMGSEFYNNFNLVKKIFNQADEKLNYPISKYWKDQQISPINKKYPTSYFNS